MYISKLEIVGFKSFATKTVLQFGKGVTAVIGPNGCGKSNVVDAIRWVMGEQKTHLLRSESMVDIIFSGSKNRKPLNYAEVSLTIHNRSGKLGVAYTDVQVGRRLYRDGSSEYLLNEVPVRLKDIQNLFIDTGMSNNAYSVIELKMVEEILNEDKSQRKLLFEEAAGINKYKSQRRSARRKLDATQEDLARLEDIVYEIESNVRSLKRQLGRYERYEGYAEELKKLEITLAQATWYDYEDKAAPLEKQLSNNQLQNEETGKQLSIEEAMLTSYKNELANIEKEMQSINEVLQEMNEKINAESSKRLVWQEKIANAQRNKERLLTEKENAKVRLHTNKEIQENLSGQLGEDDPELIKMSEELEKSRTNFEEVQQIFQNATQKLDDLRQDVREQQNHLAEIQQQILRLRDQRKQFVRLQDEEMQRREQLILRSGTQEGQVASLKKELEDKEKELKKINSRVEDSENERHRVENNIQELNKEIVHRQTAYERNRSDAAFYEELVESLEGYNPGVKYVMKTLKHPGIRGTVAELINVDSEYATAIEIALGNVAKYLVADKKSDAMDVIEELKRSKRGRVSIAPMDIMQKRVKQPLKNPFKDGNVLTHAVDIVKADKENQLLVDYFLGNVLVVRSLRDLSQDALKDSRFRYVTPDGDYMDQRAMIRGGKGSNTTQQIIGRQEKLAELNKMADKLKVDLETGKNEREDLEKERQSLIKEIGENSRQSKTLLQERLDLDKKMSALSYAVEHRHESMEEIDKKIEDYAKRILEIDQQVSSSEDSLQMVKSDEAKAQTDLERFRAEYSGIVTKRDTLNAELQDMRVALIAREKEKDNVRFQYKNATATIEEMSKRLEEIDEQNNDLELLISDGGKTMISLKDILESLKNERDKERNKRDSVYQQLSAKRDQIQKVEQTISENHRRREDAFETLRDLEVRVNDLHLRQNQLKERIFDRYHIDILKRPYEPMDMDRLEMEDKIQKLSNRIELIGPINMAVREEFNEQSQRLNFLKEQREDLLGAETSITETIEKLDTEARKQFTEIFTQIRENYKKTYKLFFEQGECDVRLEGSSDPLEADIEIFSRPKGRQMKSLRALSGGEKALTAIALLFAIYLVKPSPYCILDEIDAPLDDTNVKRFTHALEHFTEKTQFIIVTHNKLTMNACDYLYGITMQEEGVSSVVSVKFKDNELENLK
ncbi:MAG: chromosome segregation protein SMC [Candidatus Marinimicrobia bacterium]|nr:chromosome segregation protein SMC [Candidatus Neomarinimicrobiota bacterium]